jgi:hypothetical protein
MALVALTLTLTLHRCPPHPHPSHSSSHPWQVVTPDLKLSAQGGALLHVDLASVPGARRLGGSALAQAYDQVRGVV